MLIDWFTVVAQALNFLILVWLLKRFAYQPVLRVINLRGQQIAAQVAAASAAQASATVERETLRRKNEELEQHRAALLSEVSQEATATRLKLLEEARADADLQRRRLLTVLSAEQADLRRDLGNKVCEEVRAITAKTLQDLAQVSLNEAMVKVFLERLRRLDAADCQVLGASAVNAGAPLIRSAFELAPELRATIQNAVNALCGRETHVQFATAADLICGVELEVAGRQLAWSVRDYLARLGGAIDQVLATHDRSAQLAAMPAPTATR
jgi:F-type H+-transporting ATPase subunit b